MQMYIVDCGSKTKTLLNNECMHLYCTLYYICATSIDGGYSNDSLFVQAHQQTPAKFGSGGAVFADLMTNSNATYTVLESVSSNFLSFPADIKMALGVAYK